MTETISLWVQGDPKPQPRQRAYARKDGKAGTYDPGTAAGWRSRVWQVARENAPAAPWTGPLLCGLTFFFKRPKRLMRRKDPDGIIPCDHRCDWLDIDNLTKAVLDECNDILYVDDAQVTILHAAKFYTAREGLEYCTPGCELTLSRIDMSNYSEGATA